MIVLLDKGCMAGATPAAVLGEEMQQFLHARKVGGADDGAALACTPHHAGVIRRLEVANGQACLKRRFATLLKELTSLLASSQYFRLYG